MASYRLFVLHLGFFHLFDTGIADHEFIAVRNIIEKNSTFIKMALISSALTLVEGVFLVLWVANVIGVNIHILKF
jgi:hypothetical protein